MAYKKSKINSKIRFAYTTQPNERLRGLGTLGSQTQDMLHWEIIVNANAPTIDTAAACK